MAVGSRTPESSQPSSVGRDIGGRARALRRRVEAVPAPLAALLAIVVIIGLTWALLIPPWQSPDENSHFAYAQSLAERLAPPGDEHRNGFSTDQALADQAVGANNLAFRSNQIRPDWYPQDYQRYLAEASGNPSRSDGGGPNAAAYEPPLFYLYTDLAYWAASAGNAFDRYYAMRLWGTVLLATTVLGAWLLIGEVLGRRGVLQLAGAALVGLLPMESFMSTSINPDALMATLWTLSFWLGARVIKRGAGSRDVVGLCATTAGAALTQPASFALVPASLLALVIGFARSEREGRRARARILAVSAVACSVPVVSWLELSKTAGSPVLAQMTAAPGTTATPFSARQFLSYIWQFYLPRLPGMIPDRVTSGLSVYNVWVREGWGVFGWLEVWMPSWVYALAGTFTAIVGIATAVLLATFRDRLRLSLVAFFGLALLALLLGLHLTEYRSLINHGGPFLQGRYLLPVVGLFGLSLAFVLSRLPKRFHGPACAALLPLLLLLQIIALATVAKAYYT